MKEGPETMKEKAKKMSSAEGTKKITLKEQRANKMYCKSLLLHGNGKLLDYIDDDGNKFMYAQYNTRAILDCPFRSAGCEAVCYATKGNHIFPDVIESRIKSYNETRRADFSESIIYTINVEKQSKRYNGNMMLVRIHESGDFYSLQYLRKWVKIWSAFNKDSGVNFIFYTKAFKFFNMLTDAEKDIIRQGMKDGFIAISASLDDTTTPEQIKEYLKMQANYPLLNVYYCTEKVESIQHDNICDCENCAKCGTCNKATGKRTVVKIHSASAEDMKVYRKNIVA